MGGSRYIRLRIFLVCYILACLVPTLQFSPECLTGSAVSLSKNCMLGSENHILQSFFDSTKSSVLTDTLLSFLWSKFDRYSWSSHFWSRFDLYSWSSHFWSKFDRYSWSSHFWSKFDRYLWSSHFSSKFDRYSWSSFSLDKSNPYLWTLKYQRQHFSPRSLSWIPVRTQIRKQVYGCYESRNIVLLYGFFIYYCACNKGAGEQNNASSNETENSLSSDEYDATCTSDDVSVLTSKFTSRKNQDKSSYEKSGNLPKQHDWIFKYSDVLWQNVVSVYPVKQTDTWQRTASFFKLAFHEMPQMVSFLQLSNAGFKYTGYDLVVTCDQCHTSLKISDFTSSPSDVKYHKVNCSFAKAAAHEADQEVESDQWSNACLSPLSKAVLKEGACDISPVPHAQEITSCQSQWSLTAGSLQPSAAPYTHRAGSDEVVYPSNIPGNPAVSVGCADEVHAGHDIEDDGPSSVAEPSPRIGCCLDQVNKSGIFSSDPSGIRDDQQKRMTLAPTWISHCEASTTSGTGSRETENQMSDSTTEQQQFMHPSGNGLEQLGFSSSDQSTSEGTASVQHTPTMGASEQHTPEPTAWDQHTPEPIASDQHTAEPIASDQHTAGLIASGSSCSPSSQLEFVDFQPEVHYSNKEVQPSENSCVKNPGHYSYFPLGNFRLEYIPSNVRCPEVLKFFSLVAKLTVRVVVSATSRKRQWLSPPCQETKFQCGTGFAVSKPGVNYRIPDIEQTGKVSGVRKYLPYGRKHGYVYIETNRHLVGNETEAENTIVEFFYDKPNRRDVVIAKGVAVYHSCVQGDLKSVLLCRTSDMTLVNMVKECTEEMESMARNFPQNIQEGMMRRIFLFSHPHGGEKVFAFGEYVMVKYRLETTGPDRQAVTQLVKINNHTDISQNLNDVRKILLYTADTCPGSTGGVVVSFKRTGSADADSIVLDLWMHNGVDVKHGLSASIIRTVTHDDITSHGRQSVFRPSIQDDIAAEADRAANQVVTSPVFTVTQPPCHPAYAAYRKRLESYPTPFIHIHTREDLADAGFFSANYADCVRCFHCGLGLKSWRQGDIIHEEHFRNRPDCQFLLLKLRESGIDVSTLAARLRQSRSHRTDGQAAASEPNGERAEQSQPVSNTQLGLDGNLLRQTEETTIQGQVMSHNTYTEEMSHNTYSEEMSHNTHSEEKSPIESLIKNTSFPQPCPQEVAVNFVLNSSSEARDPTNVSRSAVKILEREQFYLKQIFNCRVCCKNTVKDLFLPCGELVACSDCSKLLTHCPSCNKKILATVTTYFS